MRQQFWRQERPANTRPERSKSALTVLKTEDLISPYVEIEDMPIYTFNYILGFSGGKKESDVVLPSLPTVSKIGPSQSLSVPVDRAGTFSLTFQSSCLFG